MMKMTLESETHLDWEELYLKSKSFLGNTPSFVTLLIWLVFWETLDVMHMELLYDFLAPGGKWFLS